MKILLAIFLLLPSMLRAEYNPDREIYPFSQAELEAKLVGAKQSGDPILIHSIGYAYEMGDLIDVEKDSLKLAKVYYRRAAKLGYAPAQARAGRIYKLQGSYQTAISYLRKAAKQNHPVALYEMGEAYEQGIGVFVDTDRAFNYFKQAADLGYPQADYKLATAYLSGYGVKQNIAKATEYYEKIATRIDDRRQLVNMAGVLIKLYKSMGADNHKERIFHWYKTAAQLGNVEAQMHLAKMYFSGRGVEKNEQTALAWYKKAAAGGNSEAMNVIGYVYASGLMDEERNLKEAVKWYIKGAEAGSAMAAWNMGYLYHNGYGVRKNEAEARKWFNRSTLLVEQQEMADMIKNRRNKKGS